MDKRVPPAPPRPLMCLQPRGLRLELILVGLRPSKILVGAMTLVQNPAQEGAPRALTSLHLVARVSAPGHC